MKEPGSDTAGLRLKEGRGVHVFDKGGIGGMVLAGKGSDRPKEGIDMRRLVLVFLVVFMVAALGGVAIAQPPAGAGKAPLFHSDAYTCSAGAGATTGPRYGFVVMNTNARGDLIVQVSVKRAEPNTTYDIWVNQDPGACPLAAATLVGALTTNRMGNGNAHLVVPRVAGATNFWVSVTGGELAVLRSMAVELD